MKTVFINSVKECLEENIRNPKAFFIFSTDIACRTWADWCVISGKSKAVATERFMAWDRFKSRFLRAKEEGKSAVPSLLRKIFIHDFIRQNADKADDDPTKLKKIIAPQYAATAGIFADYMSKNLASLNLWNSRMEQYKDEYGTWDLEDRDYKILFDAYKDFLDKNQLFEPSWVQDVKLEESEIEFFIMFPELLEDFEDYTDIFSQKDNVTACMLSQNIPDPAACEYPDSRSELRQTILQIIDLVHNQKKFDWTDIALSVPDLDTYRPYLERELKLYDVPFVIRAGIPLTKNSSARIFESIQNCHQTDFSYDSVRNLLLDESIPWKDKTVLTLNYTEDGKSIQKKIEVNLTKTRESLIRHGNELHCMFPYEEKDDGGKNKKIDPWIKSLHAQRRLHALQGLKDEELKDEQEIALYTAIKNCVSNFYRNENKSAGFDAILQFWFQFKDHFINDSDFTSDSNRILSRCIVHLQEMRNLEKDFCITNKMEIPSPFDFFVKELGQKKYIPQTDQKGISVFPYKISAEACFACQFVINASQKQIDVQYKRLDFLNATKRSKLNLINTKNGNQISRIFVYLYTLSPDKEVPDLIHISSAVQSFDGFSIPHSSLSVSEKPTGKDACDYLLNEKKWVYSGCMDKIDPASLPRNEIENLIRWKKIASKHSGKPDRSILKTRAQSSLMQSKDYSIKSGIQEYEEQIQFLLANKRDKNVLAFIENEKNNLEKFSAPPYVSLPKVSARGELEYFFPCPRRWTLSRLLKLKADSLEIDLLKNYEMGQLNHDILKEFMKQYLGTSLPHFNQVNNSFVSEGKDETTVVMNQIQEATEKSINRFSKSPLVKKLLDAQQRQISDSIYDFLCILLVPYGSLNAKDERKDITGIGNCTVYGVENKCITPSEDGSYLYFGIIDCLLKSPRMNDSETEGWIIIDYKSTSGSIPKQNEINVDENGLLHDFQMPMYISLVRPQSDEKQIDAAYFYSIKIEQTQKRAVIDRYINTDTKNSTQEAFEPTLKKFTEYSNAFSKKCMNGPEPYISYDNTDRLAVRVERDCSACDFKSICRTTYSIAQRKLDSKSELVK